MKILCITHADFEPPGVIEAWARQSHDTFTLCKPYQGENCLNIEIETFDFLIVMGGPQSPLKMDKYPYLKDEITLIQKAIDASKIVLGICLGAQLIGEALGAKTERSPEKEIGVYPITLTDAAQEDDILQGQPHQFTVIHWHNDMPGMTKDAVILASSPGCPRQILRYGPAIYGFQCHLEITQEGVETMLKACPEDLAHSRFTQSPQEFLQQDFNIINQRMCILLNRLASLKGSPKGFMRNRSPFQVSL